MSEELQEVVSNNPEWYQAPMTLEEIDRFIIANINTAKRSFIAIGYYLKYVRDRQLYKDGGFSGVLEYARAKFGIGASQASKYMSINDKFSVNGNSPILLEKYQEFDKTQLSEMLYLTDDQLEQVSVGMTKVEIRDIGTPEKVLEEPSFSPAKMEPEETLLAPEESERQAESKPLEFFDKLAAYWCRRSMTAEMYELAASQKEEDIAVFNQYFKERHIHSGFAPAYPAIQSHSIGYSMNDDEIIFKVDGKDVAYTWQALKELVCKEAEHNTPASRPGNFHENPEGLKRLKEIRKEIRANSNSTIQPEPGDTPLPETNPPEIVDNQPEIVNDVDEDIIPDKGCNNCKYNDMTPEQFKAIDPGGGLPCNICDDKLDQWEPKIDASRNIIERSDFPCDTCGHDINGCCDYDDESDWCEMGSAWIPKETEPEQVETVEADIIQTVSSGEYDFEKVSRYGLADVKSAIMDRQKNLAAYKDCELDAPIVKLEKMVTDALQALEESLYMHDMPELEKPETVQPELPVLKNNDQRKAFIEAYETWPVWIDLEQTGERYYRYDFEDGTSFVIRVSLQHVYQNYSRTEKIGYEHEEYFLLGVKNKWIPGMPTFTESSSNKSAMVDHLKELQKKGA